VAAVVLANPPPTARLLLVPVPSVRARVTERGLDLTYELARRAAVRLARCGLPSRVVRAVGLRRDPNDQAGLGREARVLNSRDAYAWRGRLPPGSVVVVDDVVTTGATLSAVALAAQVAGVALLGAATIAQTSLRDLTMVRGRADRPARPT
jgi:predicted amidophosphoribosyltransferase